MLSSKEVKSQRTDTENILNELVEFEHIPDIVVQIRENRTTEEVEGVCVGKIISVEEKGTILVDYPGNSSGPLQARTIKAVAAEDISRKVLLVFERNNPQLPVIIGFILEQPVVRTQERVDVDNDEENHTITNKKRIVFDAEEEIEICCGKSSLIMKKDGKIVIKGTHLISRSKGVNKIKGGSVHIN